MLNSAKIDQNFPLDELLSRLTAAGFLYSINSHLLAIQAIEALGVNLLKHPDKLKYILSPIFAQSKEEQKLFYDIFDQYYLEVCNKNENEGDNYSLDSKNAKWSVFNKSRKWYTIGLIFIITLLLILSINYFLPKEEKPVISFSYSPSNFITVGDTVFFQNRSTPLDYNRFEYKWSVSDTVKNWTGSIGLRANQSYWIADVPEGSNNRIVIKLNAFDREKKIMDSSQQKITIFCQDALPPKHTTILKSGDTLKLNIPEEIKGKYTIKWSFDPGGIKRGNPILLSEVEYNAKWVDVEISTPCKKGESTVSTFKDLTPSTLNFDPAPNLPDFNWVYYLAATLAITGFLYFIFSLLKKIKIPNINNKYLLTPGIEFKDQAPYEIPIRNQEKLVEVTYDLYAFAKSFYGRIDSHVQKINMKSSVASTISKAGYPSLVFSPIREKIEYIILIDKGNHFQCYLFDFLVNFLKGQDLDIPYFYFMDSPLWVWNSHFTNGISIDKLNLLYGKHRLIIFGNGHEFVSLFHGLNPTLKKEIITQVSQWEYKYILTPIPPKDWTHKEHLLSELFILFPCDQKGFHDFSVFIQKDGLSDDLPVEFSNWQKTQTELRPDDPTVLYRMWRSLDDYKGYLRGDMESFTYLCSLMLYPKFDWNILLKIGQALNIEITFDKLLRLSHIPILQNDKINPQLRFALISELSYDNEIKVREAIIEELIFSETQMPKGSFALAEQKVNLSIQQFGKNPVDSKIHNEIAKLHNLGLLNQKNGLTIKDIVDRYNQRNKGNYIQFDFENMVIYMESRNYRNIFINNIRRYWKRLPKWVQRVLFILAIFLGSGIFLYYLKPSWVLSIDNQRRILPILGSGDISPNGDTIYPIIPDFSFINQDNEIVTNETFANCIYIHNLFHIDGCIVAGKGIPNQLRIYEKYKNNPKVVLVSLAFDGRRDSLPRLKEYASKLGINAHRWHFLTGEQDAMFAIADDYFSVARFDPDAPAGVDHSGRLVLIDYNRHVRSFCDATDSEDVDRFMEDIDALLWEMDRKKKERHK